MIQLNLLPSVKQEFMKAQHTKHVVLTASIVASVVALSVLLIAGSAVYLVQKKVIADLTSNIQSGSDALKNTPHISDILTVQSQLDSLSALNAQKPVTSRVFGYLAQLTPTQATISDLRVDYGLNTIVISGNAPSLDVVNTFVDSLKFTSYSVKGTNGSKPAFSTVVLASFSRTASSATYSVSMNFDPAIFNTADDATLTVGTPNSPTQQPSIIFKKDS